MKATINIDRKKKKNIKLGVGDWFLVELVKWC